MNTHHSHTAALPALRRHRVVRRQDRRRRKGTALVFAVILMFALFSFLAFSIDVGYLSQSRAELRRAADASAMAGCWELYKQMEDGYEVEDVHPEIREASAEIAALNSVCRTSPSLDTSETTQEISIGYLNDLQISSISDDVDEPFYAVQVHLSKSSSRNGEVPFFFGKIFGNHGREMHSDALAVMGRQIRSFSTPPTSTATLNLLPFALDEDTYDDLMDDLTSDDYSYDPATGNVSNGSDGILEVNLYPQGTGSPGNRGTVDIGGANNSTNDIARQITDGISQEDLEDLGKPLDLSSTLTLNGDTGISAGVKDELASIIGEKRIIPIFSSVSGNGNNANYTIVRWMGVRIMAVKLTGKMSGKKLIVQPAPVLAPYGVVETDGGDYSDFVLSPVLLAR